jgi:hypothetical protein
MKKRQTELPHRKQGRFMIHFSRTLSLTIALAAALLIGSAAGADTIFIGPSSGDLDDINNWSAGLPSSTNLGIIGAGKKARVTSGVTYAGYYIDLQTGGEIDGTGLGSGILSGGEFTINGGTLGPFRGVNAAGGQIMTLNSGLWDLKDSDVLLTGSGTTINVNNGALTGQTTKGITLDDGTVLNMNGGTIGAADHYIKHIGGNTKFQGKSGTANFYGGDSYFSNLRGSHGAGTMIYNILGASGTVNALNVGDYGTKILINWAPGTGMTMTIASYDEWAETEWAAGRLTYDGDDFSTLGNWATVHGTIFDYDSSTETLSLVAVPEPASLATGLVGMMCLIGRRRRQ